MKSAVGGLPKYRQIFDSLKEAIMAGQYQAGQRLPSEAEFVKRFDTSRLTVNRALRELQLGGLIERKVGSGSYVRAAKSPGYSFGLLIPDLGTTEIFEPICRGMAQVQLAEHHELLWGKLPADATALESQARASCQQWAARKVSGVFFAPVELTGEKDTVNSRISQLLEAAGIPLVLIDRDLVTYPQRSGHDLVGIDNRRAGFILTQHLIESGSKRPVFIGRHRSAPSCLARAAGFREAFEDAGLPFHERCVFHHADSSNVEEMRQIVKDLRPDGVVCSNDFGAAQLMRSFETLSIRVPDDIKLAGFDDVKYASLLPTPLTTIHQPCADIGAAAVRAMVERIENPSMPPRDILLDFRLVVRASTAGVRAEASTLAPVVV